MPRPLHWSAIVTVLAAVFSLRAYGEEPKAGEPNRTTAQQKAEKKAARKARLQAAATAEEAAAGRQNEVMKAQWLQQYSPILDSELEYIRQTCELTPEQRPKIKAAGEASLKQAVELQPRQGLGMVINFGADQQNPRKLVRAGLAKALESLLAPEQMAIYTKRLQQRAARKKHAVILLVVAHLDGKLYLTAEQRDKLSESLSAAWQESWEDWGGIMVYQNNYMPEIPDQQVLPHLNARQATVWQGLQKISGMGQAVFIRDDEQEVENDDWWGPPAKPAATASAEPAP